MRLLHEQVMGAVVIAGLVAMGVFVAEEPELPSWMGGRFLTQSKSDQLTLAIVNSVDWSADGKTLMCLSRGGSNAMTTLTLHDFSTSSGQLPDWVSMIPGGICHSSLSPDGSSVLVSTNTGELWWIDLETSAATELVRLPTSCPIASTAFGHDGRWMAGGAENGDVHLCDPTRGFSQVLSARSFAPVVRMQFSNDSQRILCTRCDGSISIWETASGNLVDEFDGRRAVAAVAMFLADGDHIVTSGADDTIQILSIALRTQVWRGGREVFGPFGMATLDVASAGNLAAWGEALNRRIVVWDLENQQKKFEINNPSVITHLKFSPDGKLLAVAGRESIVRVYDLRNGKELRKIDIIRAVESGTRC